MNPSQSRSRSELVKAALEAAKATHWLCDDGHRHKRPEWFTASRLRDEINRRNPSNSWYGSEMACAIYDMIEDGALVQDNRLRLRVAR